MITSDKVFRVVEKLESLFDRYPNFNSLLRKYGEENGSLDINLEGLYAFAFSEGFTELVNMNSRGRNILAVDLGFRSSEVFENYLYAHPEIWGDKHGLLVFYNFDNFPLGLGVDYYDLQQITERLGNFGLRLLTQELSKEKTLFERFMDFIR